MKHYIRRFNDAESANGYPIQSVPFLSTVSKAGENANLHTRLGDSMIEVSEGEVYITVDKNQYVYLGDNSAVVKYGNRLLLVNRNLITQLPELQPIAGDEELLGPDSFKWYRNDEQMSYGYYAAYQDGSPFPEGHYQCRLVIPPCEKLPKGFKGYTNIVCVEPINE